jgi:hypothetical protein
MVIGSVAIFISFLASIMVYKKLEPKWLRLFPYYLIFTMLAQIGGYLYSHVTKRSNHFIFNIVLVIDCLFWVFVFSKSYKTAVLKKIAFIISSLFFAFAFYNISFGEGFFVYNSMTDNFGSILFIMFTFIYLGELFINKSKVNYFRIPMFWISTGLLFFNIGGMIYFSLFDYITLHQLDSDGKIYNMIMVTLNILMYGLFTIGFLGNRYLWKKEN